MRKFTFKNLKKTLIIQIAQFLDKFSDFLILSF